MSANASVASGEGGSGLGGRGFELRECVGVHKKGRSIRVGVRWRVDREAGSSPTEELGCEAGRGAWARGGRDGRAVVGDDDAAVATDGVKVFDAAVPPRVQAAAYAAQGAGA